MSLLDVGHGPETATGEGAGVHRAGRLEQQVPGSTDAPANDEEVRVEGSGKIGHATTQPDTDVCNEFDGQPVAVHGRAGDIRADEVIRIAIGDIGQQILNPGSSFCQEGASIPHERVSGRVLLPATTVAARAPVTVWNNRHMAEFTGHAITTTEHPPIDDQRPTDAGSQGETHHDTRSLASSEAELGPSGCVGVIVDENGDGDALGKTIPQRLVTPCQVRGKSHERLLGVYPPRSPDTDRANREVVRQLTN